MRELLDIWPQLPIVVSVNGYGRLESWFVGCTDNVIAALEHNDRICELDLNSMPRSEMAKLIPAMQQSFPALTRVKLQLRTRKRLCIPDLFFDNGSAPPPLQTLILDQFPFPGLPILLPSAIQLVHLKIRNMFCREYISPEQMVTYFSVMTRLERLEIEFESLPSQRSQHPPAPPKTRTLLSALTKLRVFEVGGYLEDLVARIDAPLLDKLIIVSHELISDTHWQVIHFIGRTPKFKVHDEARMTFSKWDVSITFPQIIDGRLESGISCEVSDRQLPSLTQVCVLSLPRCLIPSVEHLYIQSRSYLHHEFQAAWEYHSENSQWLELLRPFTAVKALYISREFVSKIVPALQELVRERATEVLPALQTLLFEEPLSSGPDQEVIEQFISARWLAGHPIAVSIWEDEDKPEWVCEDDDD